MVVTLSCNGGQVTTTEATLAKVPYSKLVTDQQATKTVDVRIVALLVDALRRKEMQLLVPDDFDEWHILATEARRLGLFRLADFASPSTITISCHAALSTGRLNPEITFRKVVRIVVSGRVHHCRSAFGDTLNECRDSGGNDFEEDRYTARFYLKHSNLEKSFDALSQKGYRLIQSNTFSPAFLTAHPSDEAQFLHHSQYVFLRNPKVKILQTRNACILKLEHDICK